MSADKVDHPPHYGGANDPFEPIKVILAWGLDFCVGNAVKYIARAGKKPGESKVDDLKKARWYLDRAIAETQYHESISAPMMPYSEVPNAT
jgi:hypothetical protein